MKKKAKNIIDTTVNGIYTPEETNNKTAKKIYRGTVLMKKNIQQRLAKIVQADTINKIIDNWIQRKLITPVNSTSYTTEKTFEELLASVNTRLLTTAELEQIKLLIINIL